jgi:16S rRNA G966 N2-methylase RsmD
VAAVRANLAAVGANSATVVRADVAVLLVAENPYGHFDVVFADPPYATDDARVDQLLAALVTGGWLAFDALVVLERPTKSQPTWPDGFTDVTKRGYGDTSVWYGRFEVT